MSTKDRLLPDSPVEGLVPTMNNTGWMTEALDEMSQSFVEYAGEAGGDCATCAELKARYAEHDEWLDSLQRAAEGVVAANQQAQAIAERQLGPDAVAQTPKLPGGSPKE